MSNQYGDFTPSELVDEIRRVFDATWKEIGDMIERSEKMIRKISKGETSGESYREALLEILQHGRAIHVPARRRNKAGQLVKVRAKRNAPEPVVTPIEHEPDHEDFDDENQEELDAAEHRSKNLVKKHRRRFFKKTTVMPNGGRKHVITMPKGKRSKGHQQGMATFLDTMRRAAKGQRARDKRGKIGVTFDLGNGDFRTVEIGSHDGYHLSDVLSDIRTFKDGDVEAWIKDQLMERYKGEDFDPDDYSIVQTDITIYDAARGKEERKALDQQDARRWNRDKKGNRLIDPQPPSGRKSRRRRRNRDQ